MMRGGLIAALLVVTAAVAGNFLSPEFGPDQLAATAKPAGTQASGAKASVREILSPAQQIEAKRSGLLPAGVRSLLRTGGQMRHGEFQWNEEGAPAGPLTIWVDVRTQLISVFRGGHEIGTAVIVYGDDSMETPLGRFPILSKHRDYHSRSYDAPMPFSLFITDTGVALHGSPMSRRRATHGCIGLPDKFAELLFDAAKVGDLVEVVRSAEVQQRARAAVRS